MAFENEEDVSAALPVTEPQIPLGYLEKRQSRKPVKSAS